MSSRNMSSICIGRPRILYCNDMRHKDCGSLLLSNRLRRVDHRFVRKRERVTAKSKCCLCLGLHPPIAKTHTGTQLIE